jgi:glycosyltransferase involved in cell wall biosynthesis
VHLGFDADKFLPKGDKKDMIVTAGKLKNDVTIGIKGLNTFMETAKLLPELKFILIGDHDPKIAAKWRKNAPSNLEIIDFLPLDEIIKYYQNAKIYAQLSYQESFGSAMAEAMLCECVPVVTKKGAIEEVVGDTGFYVDYGDPKNTAIKIKLALDSQKGIEARKRIAKMFPLVKRKDKLTKIINDSLNMK